MKKSFEIPEIKIILVKDIDIITTSGDSVSTLGQDVWTPWIEI